MNNFVTKIFIVIILFFPTILFAQFPKNWGIESNIYIGKIVKHSSVLLFDVENISQGFDINFKYQTYGKDAWNQYQRYPHLGVGLVYFNLGDKNLFGHAFALLPNMTIPLLKKERGFINFQFGSGIAYLTQRFDPIHNPTNNAIGSKLNNITAFKFDGGYHFSSQWAAHIGFGLTHFSNGASQLPNYGINIISGLVGLKYTPQPVEKNQWHDDVLNIPKKRWGGQVHFDIAFREFQQSGGPRYPIYMASAAGVFHFNLVNRMLVGFEIEYNVGAYHYWNHLLSGLEKKELQQEATRYMFFVADELLFGDIGVLLQTGFYIKTGKNTNPFIMYNKLSVRYYFPPIGKPATQFYAAVYLKSHKSVAEYIALGIGASF